MYHSIWMAKFRYSAPVISFTTPQLNKIQQRIIGSCLSAAGYCNKLSRAVVYGTTWYGGMAWQNIHVVSMYEKLKMLIGLIRLQDTVGKMMELQLSWLQLHAGISESI